MSNSVRKRKPIEHWKIIAFYLIIYDIVAINFSYFFGLLLRFDLAYSSIPENYLSAFLRFAPFYTAFSLIVFYVAHMYNSVWRFASFTELNRIFVATVVTTVFQVVGITTFYERMPGSYYIVGCISQFILTVAVRFMYRYITLERAKREKDAMATHRTMIIGAGAAGQMILRELKTSVKATAKPCCVIDDNPNKWGRLTEGVPIVGGRDSIMANVEKYNIDQILFAIPTARVEDRRDILNICKETKCELKTLPGVFQLANGQVSLSKMKAVAVEDLLGRDTIKIDIDSISGYVRNKVVLVTGGGGSIGSELCRQIAAHNPRMLIIFDIYENNAYDIQQELKKKYPALKLEVLIGSVRNTKRIESVMELYRPDVVYHAAAHKHVPLMEDSPNEAIKNNVFGTYKTARAADKYGVKKFVLISTDKAVNPTNIMGASKRLCEMIIQTFSRYSRTEFVAVRFGNVLGSNGSVIPLFKKQMAAGGPITVTHPDIIRYFMTIPEAVSLVLQAGAFAKGGEIFVLDMGEPVKIADLAKNLIRLSGYTLGVDMDIVYTGLRPGEKLYEEILTKEEGLQKTANNLIYVGKPLEFNEVHFLSELKLLEEAASEERRDVKEIVSRIVPTYHIKPEDKERDEESYQELLSLGKASHEKPVMEDR